MKLRFLFFVLMISTIVSARAEVVRITILPQTTKIVFDKDEFEVSEIEAELLSNDGGAVQKKAVLTDLRSVRTLLGLKRNQIHELLLALRAGKDIGIKLPREGANAILDFLVERPDEKARFDCASFAHSVHQLEHTFGERSYERIKTLWNFSAPVKIQDPLIHQMEDGLLVGQPVVMGREKIVQTADTTKVVKSVLLLHWAIYLGHGLYVSKFESHGPLVIAGMNAMNIASKADLVWPVEACKRNLSSAIEDSDSPLFVAVKTDNFMAIKALLEAGANVNLANEKGMTPLMIAAELGHENSVRMLLEHNANIYAQAEGANKLSALHLAAWNGHREIVSVILTYISASDREELKDSYRELKASGKGSVKGYLRRLVDERLRRMMDLAELKDSRGLIAKDLAADYPAVVDILDGLEEGGAIVKKIKAAIQHLVQ